MVTGSDRNVEQHSVVLPKELDICSSPGETKEWLTSHHYISLFQFVWIAKPVSIENDCSRKLLGQADRPLNRQ